MADFGGGLDPRDVADHASASSGAAAAPFVSRRTARAHENAALASRTRSNKTARRLTSARPASARSASAKSVPARAARVKSVAARPVRSSVPRRDRLVRKFFTIGAMFGAGALLVATSLPAVALPGNSASAVSAQVPTQSNSEVQRLAVDDTAVYAAPTRDPYTVVNTFQQSRMKYGDQSFAYTNDTNGTIQWPFPAPVPISSGFGGRVSPCSGCSSFHEGVDFTPGSGTPIGAVANGTVTFAAYDSSFGYHVIVDHNINGQKVQSLYAHMLAGSIKVTVGQQVTVAQELGQVGNTGHSTGAHLHLEIHLDGTPVDPFAWLKANAN